MEPRPIESLPDLELLRCFARGDAAALGELASRYERCLLGVAKGILQDRTLACDAVQETWLRVIRHAKGFDGRSSVKTWLYRILVNRAIDMRARRSVIPLNESEAPPTVQLPRDDEQAGRLAEAMAELPDASRVVLLLCHHRGLTHEQAAEVLDIPVGTLKSRSFAAMRQLRAALGVVEEEARS